MTFPEQRWSFCPWVESDSSSPPTFRVINILTSACKTWVHSRILARAASHSCLVKPIDSPLSSNPISNSVSPLPSFTLALIRSLSFDLLSSTSGPLSRRACFNLKVGFSSASPSESSISSSSCSSCGAFLMPFVFFLDVDAFFGATPGASRLDCCVWT